MIIDMKNVSWQRGDQWILNNISWQVKEKEHCCLLGLNGSGKTTLLNMINGYIWPTKGEIQVLGNTFGQVNLRELRKSIGWVSSSLQQQLREDENIQDIVVSGKFASIGIYDKISAEDYERANEILNMLGCEYLSEKSYRTLSQGEKQRILIARALMANPKLLILDEPCTGLDILAREHLLQMISSLTENPEAPTIIYVTHHVEEILPCFQKVLLLRKGEIYKEGLTGQMLTSDTMSEFFQAPIHVEIKKERAWLSLNEVVIQH
ncbi:ABC transporter ATP-binding protein [Heyndrickxia camelliae]|uniref:ABC transporter ATP-binding protein n=1 Tax=Heyndrickxia camelliae TaxID=1707093 RepID=UPI001A9C3D0C|nr:ABC transporter ATP-binding protein [Heyndrickxia camelliae]